MNWVNRYFITSKMLNKNENDFVGRFFWLLNWNVDNIYIIGIRYINGRSIARQFFYYFEIMILLKIIEKYKNKKVIFLCWCCSKKWNGYLCTLYKYIYNPYNNVRLWCGIMMLHIRDLWTGISSQAFLMRNNFHATGEHTFVLRLNTFPVYSCINSCDSC